MKKDIKDEDGYVDDWQIRKYSDCHPSSAISVYTEEEVAKLVFETFHKTKQGTEKQLQEFADEIEKLMDDYFLRDDMPNRNNDFKEMLQQLKKKWSVE